jgi:AcrR family transcriptional regulator
MPSNLAKSLRRQPKQARAQDTMEVILEAAARVLRRHGYARATTNRIAEVAGVGVGTVYEYFANKDAVFEALIRREIDALVRAFAEHAEAEDVDLEAALGRLIAAGMAAMRHGPELLRALESVPGATFRRQLAGARQVVIDQVGQLLDAHCQELDVDDIDLAAFIVVSAVEGVGANASSQNFDARLARELTALVTRYLKGPAAPSGSSS